MSVFYFGNSFVIFFTDFTVFERIIHDDDYYLQVLSYLTSALSVCVAYINIGIR